MRAPLIRQIAGVLKDDMCIVITSTNSQIQDAPKVPPSPISLYGLKRASDDIAALAKKLDAPKIVLGGHDW
jgi:hypothetical protein